MIKELSFLAYRQGVIGIDHEFETPYGRKKILYADWTASGRMYEPLERRMREDIFPLVGNTHTQTSVTGSSMTQAYHHAVKTIKSHVNAGEQDVLISSDSGMTGVVNKFQRILGLRLNERFKHQIEIPESERPIIFVTHMEHHSNQTSWLETIADVEVIQPDEEGLVDLNYFKYLLEIYADRKLKIAAVTSCSNVTGIITPYYEIAEIIHQAGGLCFVDFACSAPYIKIDMHPEQKGQHLDAIYFSPHKFLGGPGATGILVFNSQLYNNEIPDHPGGGTVQWTNPWGQHKYTEDIEAREDGGTPAFLQTIKSAFCMRLKDQMGVGNMLHREKKLMKILWDRLSSIENLHILASNIPDRLGVMSFYIEDLHYNLGVRLLNDRFGIQVRGGCSCAGTYGHYLLNMDREISRLMMSYVEKGELYHRPGWIRLSIHPIMTEPEMFFLADSIQELAANHQTWALDYRYCPKSNEFFYKKDDYQDATTKQIESWFDAPFIG